jgi:predicted RNase H-like HicB family nuclease
MTKAPHKEGFLDLTAVIWREGDDFVSLCPELGVSSCGPTLEEATAMLKEAVDLYVENARELDMLDSALEGLTSEHRWTTSFRVAV